ncbi:MULTISPECIES: hypothetical protein [unclassified Caballeronia]|uniref:hypothetical protein n=1 Tax=unclassified Caballeronia TaxID=2646786 RepID=UPI002029086D|nr:MULTISPECIES: hypothetical protein [unclassified Caballeronia]
MERSVSRAGSIGISPIGSHFRIGPLRRYQGMDTRDTNLLGAFELRMIDAEISHLRLALEAVLREPNAALPHHYWRRRLESLLCSRRLLHYQFSAITDLISKLATYSQVDARAGNQAACE